MNQRSRWLLSTSCTLVVAFAACSSSDDQKPGGTFSSGLPPSSTLGTLSDSDWAKFCGAASAYAEANSGGVDTSCKLAGITAAGFAALSGAMTDADVQKACTDTFNQCKAATADAGPGTNDCTRKPGASCTATVGEVEACLNDRAAATQAAAASIPACESLTLAQFRMPADAGSGTDTPQSCKVASQKCPGLF
jgi:hypothetical protein